MDHLAIVSDVACLRLPFVALVAWPRLEHPVTCLVAAFRHLDVVSRSVQEHSSARLSASLTGKFASMTCSSLILQMFAFCRNNCYLLIH